jgi:hypothetical protein
MGSTSGHGEGSDEKEFVMQVYKTQAQALKGHLQSSELHEPGARPRLATHQALIAGFVESGSALTCGLAPTCL